MKLGLDIHGVLDHHPEKYIKLAKGIMKAGGEVFVITGPTIEKAEKELFELAEKYNRRIPFWDNIFSIVDYIVSNKIPHYWLDNGHLWTDNKSDWDKVKGLIAKELNLDLHLDDSPEYEEFFEPGVFCLVKRRRK